MREKIAELEAQITDLKDEVRRERVKAAAYEIGLELGTQIVAVKQGLMDSGLTECEAIEIVMLQLKEAGKPCVSKQH